MIMKCANATLHCKYFFDQIIATAIAFYKIIWLRWKSYTYGKVSYVKQKLFRWFFTFVVTKFPDYGTSGA